MTNYLFRHNLIPSLICLQTSDKIRSCVSEHSKLERVNVSKKEDGRNKDYICYFSLLILKGQLLNFEEILTIEGVSYPMLLLLV